MRDRGKLGGSEDRDEKRRGEQEKKKRVKRNRDVNVLRKYEKGEKKDIRKSVRNGMKRKEKERENMTDKE